MNKIILIGNLTKETETSKTNSGITVTKFTIAVQRKFKNEKGEYDADYITIITWKELAELCNKWLTKGKKVSVVGRLQTRSYDATDGTKRYVTEVVADEVEFLTPKENAEVKLEPIDDGDLPF